MAACLTDTKDLALNPATTLKDSQRAGIDHFLYKQSFSAVLHHLSSFLLCLTCLSVALPSPLSYPFLISAFSVNKDAIFIWLLLPKTLSLPLICWSIPLLCSAPLNHSRCPRLSLCLPLSPLTLPHSLSLSFPSQQLHCPWVGANNVGPHGALRSPSREGRELQRTPITQCFKLGCGIKGSLTHGWLCGSALDHLWRRRAATGTRIPHWECVYICVWERVCHVPFTA